MRKSITEPFDYLMFVDEWQYDTNLGEWSYKLRQENGIKYECWVKESDTQKG